MCEESREGKCLHACNAVIGVTLADATGVMHPSKRSFEKELEITEDDFRNFCNGPGLTGPTFWSFAASKDSASRFLLPEIFYPCSWRNRSKCIKANFIDPSTLLLSNTWEHSWSGRG